ncbi:hypothetical protein C9374_006788 [Naegleria lovaniensis]|uniref:Uncharacterized protein n=1 Tax=Naegleria lovaniensis TaxID=51637 RepID=A0AA88H5K3_NAELO|nr:uncharacterized protein C9374_006788 [Naegleria lovaniensis]KAG2393257.1 hypothetical protein C9374_006788 [Naegleria lovaniensis]
MKSTASLHSDPNHHMKSPSPAGDAIMNHHPHYQPDIYPSRTSKMNHSMDHYWNNKPFIGDDGEVMNEDEALDKFTLPSSSITTTTEQDHSTSPPRISILSSTTKFHETHVSSSSSSTEEELRLVPSHSSNNYTSKPILINTSMMPTATTTTSTCPPIIMSSVVVSSPMESPWSPLMLEPQQSTMSSLTPTSPLLSSSLSPSSLSTNVIVETYSNNSTPVDIHTSMDPLLMMGRHSAMTTTTATTTTTTTTRHRSNSSGGTFRRVRGVEHQEQQHNYTTSNYLEYENDEDFQWEAFKRNMMKKEQILEAHHWTKQDHLQSFPPKMDSSLNHGVNHKNL